jgi:hypothetical protein
MAHCHWDRANETSLLSSLSSPGKERALPSSRHPSPMASSTLAGHPVLPSLPAPNPSKPVSFRTSVRRLLVAASAAPSGAAAAARERRRFLERYGLNPDDFEEDAEVDPRVCSNDFGFLLSDLLCGLV